MPLHVGSDKMRGLALVKTIGAFFHQAFERLSQLRLFEEFTRFVRTAIAEEDAFGIGESTESILVGRGRQLLGQVIRNDEAFRRKKPGGLKELAPWFSSILTPGKLQTT